MNIKTLYNELKLKLFITTRTLGYTEDYAKILYKIYLNHNKIIHYQNGYPVYSLSTPPLFSKPSANMVARSFYKSVQNRPMPNLLSFAINDVCNAGCEHCSFFNGVDDKTKDVLSLEQTQQVITASQELGVSMINFVGGEPLMREDLPEIIAAVDKDLSSTSIFTNGWYLEERVKELKAAGLDYVYVSIDSANPRLHDKFRKRKELFDRAITGIKKAKSLGLSCGISSTMTPEAFKKGELERIIELGKKIGIHEVLVFDALPTGRYRHRKDLIDKDWADELIEFSKKYNDDPAYPGILIHAYTTSHRSVGCACGTSYFYVSPYGDVMSCDFNHAIMGNIKNEPLYRIWERMSSSDAFKCSKWGGCKIKSSDSLKDANCCAASNCCNK